MNPMPILHVMYLGDRYFAGVRLAWLLAFMQNTCFCSSSRAFPYIEPKIRAACGTERVLIRGPRVAGTMEFCHRDFYVSELPLFYWS